jgi:hypothetical protein
MSNNKFVPIVIMGATRSGTNALRDSLVSLDNFGTWPCDEINPIWKYRSLSKGYDNLSKDDLSQAKIKYIRAQFTKQFNHLGCPKFIIEKTCANTLRPSFVNGVFPDAKYIFIIRDGAEVINSARRRWQGNFEYNLIQYWMKKIKYIPILDFFHYFYNMPLKRLTKKILRRSELDSWGPTHPTLDKFKNECSLGDLIALQWSLCVISSWYYFRNIGPEKCVFTSYNELINNPDSFLLRFGNMVGENLTSPRDVEAFSAGLFSSKKLLKPYVVNHPIIAKYYNSAMKIYSIVNESINK